MVNGHMGTIGIGSSVRIRDGELEEDWRIVANHEADPLRRRLSESSPLAKALLGHRAGDCVPVRSPAGQRPVTILSVGGMSHETATGAEWRPEAAD